MLKKPILLVFVLFLSIQLGFSQYQEAKDGIGIRAVFPNYQWAFDREFIKDEFGAGFEVEYVRHLNNYLNLALPLRLNKVFLPLDEFNNFEEVGLVGFDATLQVKAFKESLFIYPYLLAGIGVGFEDFKEVGFSAPLGLGINFRLAKHAYLSTKGEYRIGFEDLRSNLQLGVGMHFIIGEGEPAQPIVQDRDQDGVPDEQDLCPDIPGVAGLNGCPDSDGDGITDGADDCPTIAGVAAFNGCPDTDADGLADNKDGCPTEAGPIANNGCPLRDADADGVADDEDACPNTPGTAATAGCPDQDGDGLADKDDQCPMEAGPAATNGCPDGDNDGVINSLDKCPDTPGPASNSGCPEITEEDKETLDFAVQAVQFETGRSTLKSTSLSILDKIVDIMKRYPDYKLTIGGHTDSIGSSRTNQSLSEKRAKACYDYLISKDINPNRVRHVGYGESRPIDDNRYKAGREKNRRVEFDLYVE